MAEKQDALANLSAETRKVLEGRPLMRRALASAMRQAETLEITDPDTFEAAFTQREHFTAAIRQIEELLNPNIKRLFDAHRLATKERNTLIAIFEGADKIVEGKRIAWKRERDRLAKEESDRLSREAREQQERDAVETAAELERQGEHEAAAAVTEMVATAPTPVVHVDPGVPKSKGSVTKKGFTWTMINPGLLKPEFRMPDEKKIGVQVRSMGKAAEGIVGPGSIRVDEVESEDVRLS